MQLFLVKHDFFIIILFGVLVLHNLQLGPTCRLKAMPSLLFVSQMNEKSLALPSKTHLTWLGARLCVVCVCFVCTINPLL